MQIISPDVNIDFVGKRRNALVLSCIIIIIAVISLVTKGGPNYGIDFAGGTLVQVRFKTPTSAAGIKRGLMAIQLEDSLVQQFGEADTNEYLIRLESSDRSLRGLGDQISRALEDHFGKEVFEIRRVEMVGPKVGKDLRKKGLLSILYALIGILIYISWRFQLKFAAGAVLALFHDVMITVGAFSVLNKEISLPIVAALLTIVGYSLNDTIVVYDRVRENTRKSRRDPFEKVVNRSINETLSRTILTSGTTLFVVLALFFFGGGVIHDFAFALLVGVLVGTYSSIFIASPVVIFWESLWGKKVQKKR
jgi:preprotein translocase subunit SecF